MSPTIKSNELVVADMAAYRKVGPQRWDVVVFHPPASTGVSTQFWVMRVIGLPNEEIALKGEGVYVDGKHQTRPTHLSNIRYGPVLPTSVPRAVSYPCKIPVDSYFLCGDNTTNAFDSRFWGPVPRQDIVGRMTGK